MINKGPIMKERRKNSVVTTDTPLLPLSPEPSDSGLPIKAVLEPKPPDLYQIQTKHQAEKEKKNVFSDSDIFSGSASFSDNVCGIFSGSVSDFTGISSVTFDFTFRFTGASDSQAKVMEIQIEVDVFIGNNFIYYLDFVVVDPLIIDPGGLLKVACTVATAKIPSLLPKSPILIFDLGYDSFKIYHVASVSFEIGDD
ncbi:hypothetical protein RYX36_030216 [Vicia faba]